MKKPGDSPRVFSGRIGSWRVEGTSKTYQDWHEEKLAKAGAVPTDAE